MAGEKAEERMYLVHVEVYPGTRQRYGVVMGHIMERLRRIASIEPVRGYHSEHLDVGSAVVLTTRSARQIRNAIQPPSLRGQRHTVPEAFEFDEKEKLLIVELGRDVEAIGMGTLLAWLQHR